MIGHHQIELTSGPTETMQELAGDRGFGVESQSSGSGLACLKRAAFGEDVGNEVDVGRGSTRHLAFEMEMKGDHLSADQDPGVRVEIAREFGNE